MIQIVVFDMAGTTIDEDNVVYKTLQKAIQIYGYEFSLEEVLSAGAGKEKLQAIQSVLALRNIEDKVLSERIFERFQLLLTQAYASLPIKEQAGCTDLFHALRHAGIKVVMNTGYDRKTANSLIQKIGWVAGRDFDGLVTASDVKQNRPEPDMILLAMEQQEVKDPKAVVKVGDSVIDIAEGRNAGCLYSIGITTGANTEAQLKMANPDFILHQLSELLPIVTATNKMN
jgi:phosphonatase-like hydrolase